MIVLLRKDFRVYRAAFVAWVIAILCTFGDVAGTFGSLGEHRIRDAVIFAFLAWVGEASTICLVAIFGACAFAIERRDRSGEFLAMIPVGRRDILGSKLILAAVAIVPLWLMHSTVIFISDVFNMEPILPLGSVGAYQQLLRDSSIEAYLLSAANILFVFSVAWLISAVNRSPAIAASVSLAVFMLVVISAEQLHMDGFSWPHVESVTAIVAAVTGIGRFIAGTVIFVKRVSP